MTTVAPASPTERRTPSEAIQPDPTIQTPGGQRGFQVAVELDEMPAQPVLMPGALGDEIGAVIDQQPNLHRRLVQPSYTQKLWTVLKKKAAYLPGC